MDPILASAELETAILEPTEADLSCVRQRSQIYNVVFGLLNSSAGLYFGYFNTILNPLGGKLLSLQFQVEDVDSYLGMANFLYSIGAMIGCLTSGPMANKIGRVKTMIILELY